MYQFSSQHEPNLNLLNLKTATESSDINVISNKRKMCYLTNAQYSTPNTSISAIRHNYYSNTHGDVNQITKTGDLMCNTPELGPRDCQLSTYFKQEQKLSQSLQWHMPCETLKLGRGESILIDTPEKLCSDNSLNNAKLPTPGPTQTHTVEIPSPDSESIQALLNLSTNAKVGENFLSLSTHREVDIDSDCLRTGENYSPSIYDQFNTKQHKS